jgi:hypothetical protein
MRGHEHRVAPESQKLAFQACARAVLSAALAAGQLDIPTASNSLERAKRQLQILQGQLPLHSRRVRMARDAVYKAEQAFEEADATADPDGVGRSVGKAQRAARAILEQ